MEDLDSIVRTVIGKFAQRAAVGKAKYGVTLDRTDLSVLDWINHAQEEHMDAILYLEKLRQTLAGAATGPPVCSTATAITDKTSSTPNSSSGQ
ncbi:hypothetical protein EBZ80_21890 [bacterium]|nr:hypothetical protein [bacterium]